MADIFLSYSREDEARIKSLVTEFEAQGWTVFWDRRIPAGETWRSYIGTALQDARCIVVAWSQSSNGLRRRPTRGRRARYWFRCCSIRCPLRAGFVKSRPLTYRAGNRDKLPNASPS